MIFLSLFLCLVGLFASATSLNPSFSCWFTTYRTGTPLPNIVIGYENTGAFDLSINNTEGGDNVLTPAVYNGLQPILFKPGRFPLSFIVSLERERDSLEWTINGSTLIVDESDRTELKRCVNSDFASQCPTSVDNFCEDGSYCNGNEICFPNEVGGPVGICHRTTETIVCEDNTLVCSDSKRACVAPETESPTSEPSNAPTGAPTSEPTNSAAPTVLVISDETACLSDLDCIGELNFCNGPRVCNQLTSFCVKQDVNYDPCLPYRATLRNYYDANNASSFPISIICSESQRLCVESFTCQTNMDCSDNLVCNGEELCIGGSCHYQRDQSIGAICHTALPMTCTEPEGCVPIEAFVVPGSPTSPPPPPQSTMPSTPHQGPSPTIIGIIVAAIVFAGLVILGIILYFNFGGGGDSFQPSMTIGQYNLASKMRGPVNFGVKYQ